MKALRYTMAMLCLLMTSGCWDRVEIEERGFVVGVAIDLVSDDEVKERAEKEAPNKPQGKHRFVLTQQFINPKGYGTASTQGSSGIPAYFNISSEGDSMMEMVRSVAARTSRSPYYEHIKIIIVSDKIAEAGELPNVLDFFLRHPEMRRGTKVMIAEGTAKDTLEIQAINEMVPVQYIESISQNYFKNARMSPTSRLGDINEDMLTKRSFIVQKIILGNDGVKVAGNAVIKGATNEMVGYLGEEETEGRNYITGEVEGGIIEFMIHDNLIIYEVEEASRTIKADVSHPEHIKFKIQIETKGLIVEALEQVDMLDPNVIAELESQIEKQIVRQCEAVIGKTQVEFKTDVLMLSNYLKADHYDAWNRIKDDWDTGENYFSSASIEVDVSSVVRNIGSVIESEAQ